MESQLRKHERLDLRWLRQTVELSSLFIIVVILLRGFVLEGYLISTGSMAPNLLGFHKRIICPSCENLFAFGVTFDESVEPIVGQSSGDGGLRSYATCPNCGQVNINVSVVPNAHGDQLLVQKHVYAFRSPRRWEVVVFRSPQSPGEAFVKRVVGLPGDRLLIRDGDLFVDGLLARRDFATQRAMRILVSDLHHLASDENWQMSWKSDERWVQAGDTLKTDESDAYGKPTWIQFRHWRWHGGDHYVETPLSRVDAREAMLDIRSQFQNLPVGIIDRVEFDSEHEVLRTRGVMPEELQRFLLSRSSNDAFHSAVYRIAALSHLSPVTDLYGYNSMVAADERPVRDLMLRATVSWVTEPDSLIVDVPITNKTFQVQLNPSSNQVTLSSLDDDDVHLTGHFDPRELESRTTGNSVSGVTIEVSNFDRQILVAVNGKTCLEYLLAGPSDDPVVDSAATADGDAPDPPSESDAARRTALLVQQQQRWRLGVIGSGVQIESMQMYRDVYYTPGRRVNAVRAEFKVPPDSYFVQGDNSPVSSDSRNWARPCVPHELLLGKPFLVHLPSYPATLTIGQRQIPIRIPDFSRIRYIR
jgi:signal peptidase I